LLFAAISTAERMLKFTVAIAQPALLPTAHGAALLPSAGGLRRYKVYRILPERKRLS